MCICKKFPSNKCIAKVNLEKSNVLTSSQKEAQFIDIHFQGLFCGLKQAVVLPLAGKVQKCSNNLGLGCARQGTCKNVLPKVQGRVRRMDLSRRTLLGVEVCVQARNHRGRVFIPPSLFNRKRRTGYFLCLPTRLVAMIYDCGKD